STPRGTAANITPDTALLQGTVRTTSAEVRDRAHELIRQLPAGIASAHGATADVESSRGYPATVNDDEASALATLVATELFGEDRVSELPWPSMGSEDFSYMLQRGLASMGSEYFSYSHRRVPGAMLCLGATPADRDPEAVPQTHSNKVVLDESALPTRVAMHVAMAERLLVRG